MNHFLPTIVTLSADAEPSCAGLYEMFDSTDPLMHEQAKRLCAMCPVIDSCRTIRDAQRDSFTGRLALTGTWAGELYGEHLLRRKGAA